MWSYNSNSAISESLLRPTFTYCHIMSAINGCGHYNTARPISGYSHHFLSEWIVKEHSTVIHWSIVKLCRFLVHNVVVHRCASLGWYEFLCLNMVSLYEEEKQPERKGNMQRYALIGICPTALSSVSCSQESQHTTPGRWCQLQLQKKILRSIFAVFSSLYCIKNWLIDMQYCNCFPSSA